MTPSQLLHSPHLSIRGVFVQAKAIKPPHQFFQGKGEGAAEDLAANQWTQQMGSYQCISYWYVGGWNQHGWPLNHFSAPERRFCYNVPVETWNFCKGSYRAKNMNPVKTNCKRNSPQSGMYVGVILLMKMTSKFRYHHYYHFICNIYFYTFASNSSKTN